MSKSVNIYHTTVIFKKYNDLLITCIDKLTCHYCIAKFEGKFLNKRPGRKRGICETHGKCGKFIQKFHVFVFNYPTLINKMKYSA